MSRIRYFWYNLLDVATLQASSELSSLPVSNLKHPLRTLVWRTPSGRKRAECVFIDLGGSQEIKAVIFINHNLTSSPDKLRLWGSSRKFGFYNEDSNGSWFTSAIWLFYGYGNYYSSKGHDLTLEGTGSAYKLRTDKGATIWMTGSSRFKRLDGDCGADFDFGTGNFTLEGWIFNAESPPAALRKLMEKMSGNQGFTWSLDTNGKMNFDIGDGITNVAGNSNTAVNNGMWHFIAIVVDRTAGTAKFYLDGNWDGTLDISAVTGSVNCDADLYVGGDSGGSNDWYGRLGAIKVTKGAARSKAYLDASFGTPEKVETLTYHQDIVIKCFTADARQYWGLELSDINNADDYLELGRLFLGKYFEPSRQFARNWEELLVDPSRIEQSEGGQEWVDLKEKYRLLRVEFPEGAPLSDSDRQSYRTILDKVGCSQDLFIALDYDNAPNKWSLYGKFAQTEFNFREFLNGLYSTGFDFRESR